MVTIVSIRDRSQWAVTVMGYVGSVAAAVVVPLLAGVEALVGGGNVTGASVRNWGSYGGEVRLGSTLGRVERDLLTDPQTSGGLLVSCAQEDVDQVLKVFAQEGFESAGVIGRLERGEPVLEVS